MNKAAALPGLNREDVYVLELPIPLLPDQKRIVGILKEQMEAVERLRKALEEQLEAINKLPAALLRQAFEGKL